MKSCMDWSWLIVPSKIKNIIYKPFPEGDCPDEGFPDGFFVVAHEKVGIWWGSFGSHGCTHQLEEVLIHE